MVDTKLSGKDIKHAAAPADVKEAECVAYRRSERIGDLRGTAESMKASRESSLRIARKLKMELAIAQHSKTLYELYPDPVSEGKERELYVKLVQGEDLKKIDKEYAAKILEMKATVDDDFRTMLRFNVEEAFKGPYSSQLLKKVWSNTKNALTFKCHLEVADREICWEDVWILVAINEENIVAGLYSKESGDDRIRCMSCGTCTTTNGLAKLVRSLIRLNAMRHEIGIEKFD